MAPPAAGSPKLLFWSGRSPWPLKEVPMTYRRTRLRLVRRAGSALAALAAAGVAVGWQIEDRRTA